MAVIFPTMRCAIPFAVLLLVLFFAPVSAERLTGTYVVIDTAVVGRVDDPALVATRTFRYNDTVRAVRRNGDSVVVKYNDIAYRLPFASIVKASEFKRYRRTVAIISDSAEVRATQSTIWVRKGAVLPLIGDVEADRIRVLIYGQQATVSRRDVLFLQPQADLMFPGDDDPDERPFRVRPGVGFGVATPLSDEEYLDGGFSWAANIDVRVGTNNFFITAGYSESTFSFEDWTGVIGSAALGMLHAGVIVGLTSEPVPLVPYAQLNLGLLTDDGSAMLIGGLGLDYYFTSRATAFVEVMPTYNIDRGAFFWLPIRVGMKYGI